MVIVRLALLLLVGCDFVPDEEPPRGLAGRFSGDVRGVEPEWVGAGSLLVEAEERSVTGTLVVAGVGCRGVYRLEGERDARFLEATLTGSTATIALAAHTLGGRIVGTYQAMSGRPCWGLRGALDLAER